ncbi:MAG: phosphatidate cytidylyltransferase, partial [Alistipes sp.]|nr:phosphatidate cytidylyltransferase [Alistipes sp.]
MRNLVVRTLSGAVLLGIVLAAAYLGKYSYGALLFVIMVVGMAEFYRLAKITGSTPQVFVGLITGVALFVSLFIDFACGDEPCSNNWIAILQTYFLALIPTSFIIELFKVSQTPLRNIATTLMGVLY